MCGGSSDLEPGTSTAPAMRITGWASPRIVRLDLRFEFLDKTAERIAIRLKFQTLA